MYQGMFKTEGLMIGLVLQFLSLIGLFNIIGVLIMGYLSDKYSKKMLLAGLYFFRAISIMLFIFLPPSNISAIAFGITFGLYG